MPKFNDNNLPLFYYLGMLQFLTALFAGAISFLFIKFPDGKLYDIIVHFLPDVSMRTWSTIGLVMLAAQLFGNLWGGVFSFLRSDSAGSIAIVLGVGEMLWMIFQYFILHTHNILMLLFFLLALAQLIFGYLLSERLKELNGIAH